MPKTEVVVLSSIHRFAKVHLIGTAHVSKESTASVRRLIQRVGPKVVFLELCSKRSELLTKSREELLKPIDFRTLTKSLRNGSANLFSIVYSLSLRTVSKELDVLPGEEFREAADAAKACNARVVLGDRDVDITIQRIWNGLTFVDKGKLLGQILLTCLSPPPMNEMKSLVEKMKQRGDEFTEALLEIGEEFPWIVECLISERDMFMVWQLKGIIESMTADSEGDIVAVVGAGHLDGIERIWDQETSNPGSVITKDVMKNILKCPAKHDVAIDESISVPELRRYARSRREHVAALLKRLKDVQKKEV
jgi:pheromone shutdown protein TraB